jgi:hypothetical protein
MCHLTGQPSFLSWFFLGGETHLKAKVYVYKHHTLQGLKQYFRDQITVTNYVCHHTDWLTEGGGTAILVQWGIDHYAVPIQGVRHLMATVIQVMLASKPVKILGQSTYHPASLLSIWICLPALGIVFPF